MLSKALWIMMITLLNNVESALKCPSTGQWNHRALHFCKHSKENYTCLNNTVTGIYEESCDGPRKELQGYKTTVNMGKHFDGLRCSKTKYQPFTYTTNGNAGCIYQKSLCTEEGQIYYDLRDVSPWNDTKCICNFTNGYALVNEELKYKCFCVPSEEDCTCFKKICAPDEELTQEYKCVKTILVRSGYTDNQCLKPNVKIDEAMNSIVKDLKDESQRNSHVKENSSTASRTVLSVIIVVMIVFIGLLGLSIYTCISCRQKSSKGNIEKENDQCYSATDNNHSADDFQVIFRQENGDKLIKEDASKRQSLECTRKTDTDNIFENKSNNPGTAYRHKKIKSRTVSQDSMKEDYCIEDQSKKYAKLITPPKFSKST